MIPFDYFCLAASIVLLSFGGFMLWLLHAEIAAYRRDIEKCLPANRGRNTRQSNP